MKIYRPSLLLNENITKLNFINDFLTTDHNCLDEENPSSRFRAIKIVGNENPRIITCQLNIAKIKDKIARLPSIVTIDLDSNSTINSINLHSEFRGSKSPICQQDYLNNNLKKTLIGCTFINGFERKCKLNSLKCFHLTELILEAFSFYSEQKSVDQYNEYEEEVIDSYTIKDDLIITGLYKTANGKTAHASLVFNDLFRKIDHENGLITKIKDVKLDLHLNNKKISTTYLSNNFQNDSNYTKFLYKATNEIKQLLYPTYLGVFYNTLFHPMKLNSLTIQTIGLYLTKCEPNKFLNVLNYLQRQNGRPMCIGGISGPEEGKKYFPGLNKYLNQDLKV